MDTYQKVANIAQIDNTKNLIDFCDFYKSKYIFGYGTYGKAIAHYLEQCDVDVDGFVVTLPSENDERVFSVDEFRGIYVPGETGLVLGIGNLLYNEVLPVLQKFIKPNDIFYISEENKQRMAYSLADKEICLTVRLTYNCNHNCRCCNAIAPLADKNHFLDIDLFKRDLLQMKPLFDVQDGKRLFYRLTLHGGEPLLHPKWMEFAEYARGLLPDTPILLSTNGILLPKLKECEIAQLAHLKITMNITDYGFDLDLSSYSSLAVKYGLKERWKGRDETVYKQPKTQHFVKFPLGQNSSAPKHEYLHCWEYDMGRGCGSLFDGKFFFCNIIYDSVLLNNRFGTSFEIAPDDYIDIYKATREDIFKYFKKRPPFCGYCRVREYQMVPFGRSQKQLDEWVVIE